MAGNYTRSQPHIQMPYILTLFIPNSFMSSRFSSQLLKLYGKYTIGVSQSVYILIKRNS
jgi:hypothetical protein